MYRLLVCSVNGGKYTLPVEFLLLDQIKHYTLTTLRTLTCYWQVFALNEKGERVLRGYRDGYNATGKNWIWEEWREA